MSKHSPSILRNKIAEVIHDDKLLIYFFQDKSSKVYPQLVHEVEQCQGQEME